MQVANLVDEQLQALDLNRGARKAVQHHTVAVYGVQEPAQQDTHHFFVANHHPVRLELLHLGRRQELADHDRRTRQAAGLTDEARVRPLACPGGAAEENHFLGKPQMLAADFLLEAFPGRCEDDPGVLDFQIDDLRGPTIGGK